MSSQLRVVVQLRVQIGSLFWAQFLNHEEVFDTFGPAALVSVSGWLGNSLHRLGVGLRDELGFLVKLTDLLLVNRPLEKLLHVQLVVKLKTKPRLGAQHGPRHALRHVFL